MPHQQGTPLVRAVWRRGRDWPVRRPVRGRKRGRDELDSPGGRMVSSSSMDWVPQHILGAPPRYAQKLVLLSTLRRQRLDERGSAEAGCRISRNVQQQPLQPTVVTKKPLLLKKPRSPSFTLEAARHGTDDDGSISPSGPRKAPPACRTNDGNDRYRGTFLDRGYLQGYLPPAPH